MQAQRRLESFPQPPRHRTKQGLRPRTTGNRTRTRRVSKERGHTGDTRSHESSCLQRLASSHSMNGAPGTSSRAASSQVDSPVRKDSSRSRHRDRNPLGPGTHWHPRKRGSRSPSESGENGPQFRHIARASIHLGGKQNKRNL